MQNKFGFHICKDYGGEPYPVHEQVYFETTVEDIGMGDYTADTVQKTTRFNLTTEQVEDIA